MSSLHLCIQRDAGRQKTISRLLENIFNYTLYFFSLLHLSILGLPVSSLIAGAGFAGGNWYGAQGFFIDVNGFFILLNASYAVGMKLSGQMVPLSSGKCYVGIEPLQPGEDQVSTLFQP